MSLDDGGVTRSQVRSAKVDVEAQNLTRLQMQQNVRLEVRQAAINIRNAQAQVTSATTGVSQAQEALRLARERYGAGLGTFLDVLNALAQVAQTRTNLSNAQFFYQSSLAQLVRAMGGR
jgi:outer membrane protein TolC